MEERLIDFSVAIITFKQTEIMNAKTCIIVDDEWQARERLISLLEEYSNLDVIADHGDSNQAIKDIILSEPDIVFIDVEMPRKSGFDVVKEVRAAGVYPTFIFVTGYNQYAIKAIKNAAFDYILKPIDVDELKEAINRYFGKYDKPVEADNKSNRPQLSDREKQIVKLLVEGKTSKEIGRELCLSKHTIDTHRRNILRKAGTKTTAELITMAHKYKLF